MSEILHKFIKKFYYLRRQYLVNLILWFNFYEFLKINK